MDDGRLVNDGAESIEAGGGPALSRRSLTAGAVWSIPAIAAASAAPAHASSCLNGFGTTTYSYSGTNYYTGNTQTWTAPDCPVTVTFTLIGGSGGNPAANARGRAARVTGSFSALPGDVLTLYVAAAGTVVTGMNSLFGGWGFGRGGTNVVASGTLPASTIRASGGGGSALRLTRNAVTTTLAVSGGGGGQGFYTVGSRDNNANGVFDQGVDTGFFAIGSETSVAGYVAGDSTAGTGNTSSGAAGPVGRVDFAVNTTLASNLARVVIPDPGRGATTAAPGAGGGTAQFVSPALRSNGTARFAVLNTYPGTAGTAASATGGNGGNGSAFWMLGTPPVGGSGGGGGGGYNGGGGGSTLRVQGYDNGNNIIYAGVAGYGGGGASYLAPAVTGGAFTTASASGNGSITLSWT